MSIDKIVNKKTELQKLPEQKPKIITLVLPHKEEENVIIMPTNTYKINNKTKTRKFKVIAER